MMKQAAKIRSVRGSFSCGVMSLSAVAIASGLSVAPAYAQQESPSKASCAQAYESAQESRASGQLQETRERLSFCARPECPSFVQKDCARWLEEVDKELPSIVLYPVGLAPDAAPGATVRLDGKEIPGALAGGPIVLDPGRHELIVERPGEPPITRVIMAQQGVQNRAIRIELGTAETANGAGVAELPPDTASSSPSPLRPYAYAAWGVGAVGLGVFAVMGTLGRADERALKDECPLVATTEAEVGPGVCDQETIDERQSSYQREFIIADVGLITGIVGAAAGTVLFFLSAPASSDAESVERTLGEQTGLRVDISPTPGGAFATVRSAF
jgi:hypothetical protein